ncbi:uncharacterized protein MCYG_06258 [Microsporum canis CBS 113480]|uniref:Uncharacterized protein n=1 Tax=Arthroderma otae (strain ATCC MYA-4605 / CBS 113480) TaxID=554155 RepID=C5FU55_ARTOC|nr:uncharacterized protein MCYG_06258 [Microsporum canis CBS 113480]EEQ33439.1 predicted protein [Microsporum canis CBS 113480]
MNQGKRDLMERHEGRRKVLVFLSSKGSGMRSAEDSMRTTVHRDQASATYLDSEICCSLYSIEVKCSSNIKQPMNPRNISIDRHEEKDQIMAELQTRIEGTRGYKMGYRRV